MAEPLFLIGRIFGRLVVASQAESTIKKTGSPERRWLCKCQCGNTVKPTTHLLTSGQTQSCGCLQRDRTSAANRRHGFKRTRVYQTWCNIISRCGDAVNHTTKEYGQRGIRMCDRWRESFENFYADMGQPPTDKHSIERKDSDGDYCLENCVWATRVEQNNNTRRNHVVTFNGRTQTISQWAREIGIRPALLHARLTRLKWPISRAMTEVPNPRRQAAHRKSK